MVMEEVIEDYKRRLKRSNKSLEEALNSLKHRTEMCTANNLNVYLNRLQESLKELENLYQENAFLTAILNDVEGTEKRKKDLEEKMKKFKKSC